NNERVIKKRAYQLARQAWEAMVGRYGDCFGRAYEDGFIDGFVDYIVYGGCVSGCGESPVVPAVPPPHYVQAKYMSAEGLREVEEWYTGFRHGSATAMASGLRNLVVVPVFNPPVFPSNETEPRTSTDMPDASGRLPAPRPLTDAGGASLVPGSSI